MLFNSVDYLLFLPLVTALYFVIPVKWRWAFLLLASYFFYMCWKAEYAILILFTTLVDYFVALKMDSLSTRRQKKPYLILSLAANLGMLAGFKYLNFFSESVNFAMAGLDLPGRVPVLDILLPVGISFYIFQSLSYTVDVYRGTTKAERHAGKFALYVSFFPQLVAGPIERSNNLLPQVNHPQAFSQVRLVSGLKLIAWGFFKKVVIADRLGVFVSYVYENPDEHKGITILLATVLFAFQLYGDFSGYTDIARGSARILGYDLMINFNRPMIARSLRDFWNRWHISLTTWFRDYLLYSIPYVKNKKVMVSLMYRNLVITYLLMGLWHGAAWTFVIFGLFHGILLVLENITENYRLRFFRWTGISRFPGVQTTLGMVATFILLVFSLFFFRAGSIENSFILISNAFDFSTFKQTIGYIIRNNELIFGILMVIVLLTIEYFHEKYNLVKLVLSRPTVIRWALYAGCVIFILFFGVLYKQKFIYFQF
ncbi:MAG TPA: MBOAT family O-acyltransferase [Bacteroidales bacterium]|nr:MBOAT family O-acyltransferase [Bacteroidales bacterium]HPI87136.1 MBOAT family O-acyltransferase [Bacteroidales bacterium]HPM91462.1 MBOAT family O-acyltransferase [Bacteroidales bacterium]